MVLISEVFVLFFLLAFLADRLPLVKSIRKIAGLSKNSGAIIGSNTVSDVDKQKLLLLNSVGLFKQSLILAVLILLVLLAGYLLIMAADFCGTVKIAVLLAFLETFAGIAVSILSFCCFFIIKKVYGRARS